MIDLTLKERSCCFGKKWSPPAKLDGPNFKLMGVKISGGAAVDFNKQVAYYVLYDGDRILYQGFTTECLGKSLYKHTIDHRLGHWDKFSWYGLRPVNEKGELDQIHQFCSLGWIADFMIAITTELFGPGLNGEWDIEEEPQDIVMVEYIQKE